MNVWRPPKFEKSRNAAARAQMRERERERMEMTPTYTQRGQAGDDELSDKFMENNMVGHAGGVFLLPPEKASEVAKITGKKRPLQQINVRLLFCARIDSDFSGTGRRRPRSCFWSTRFRFIKFLRLNLSSLSGEPFIFRPLWFFSI